LRRSRASRVPRPRPASSSAFAIPRRAACLGAAAVASALIALSGCASAPPSAPAPRDGFPLDPRGGLAGPFDASIEKGWRALEAGDPAGARREFANADGETSRRAGAIGSIEALVALNRAQEAEALCVTELELPQPTLPLWTACGEAAWLAGDEIAAFERYERAAARSPESKGIARRTDELRERATDVTLAAAQRDVREGRRADASSKLAQALAWNPGSAPVLARVAEVECAAGEKESALRYYRDALALGGVEEEVEVRAGDLALETGDFSMAVMVFDSLAARNPGLKDRAAEARLAFRVDNWPEAERQAARSRRLTRAGAALLVSWMFPELREGRVQSGVVAGDVLERRDRSVLMRAVALGLLDVDPETHRARPDAALSRGAAAQLLLRLAVVLARPGGPTGCLAAAAEAAKTGAEAMRLAGRCGLLSESGGTSMSGPEMTRGLDRLRSTYAVGEAARRD
jgi:tetratricopeptide (TPR) repeat protein